MNKKTLIIIVSAVVVVGAVYFGYQKGLFSGGIRSDSMMGAMKKQGETIMSKSEFISKCKESDKDTQDMCYGMGAFYYRDESFCKLVEDAEAKKNCTKENIEQWYGSVGAGGVPGLPGMGGLPGGGIIPPDGEGIIPPSDGGDFDAEESPTPTLGSNPEATDELCIEVMALSMRGMELYSEQNIMGMGEIGKKLEAFEKKYGITDIDAFSEACTAKFDNAGFMDKVNQRMRELGSKAGF